MSEANKTTTLKSVEVLHQIVQSIVKTGEYKIFCKKDEAGHLIEILVPARYMGIMVGESGRSFESLKLIIKIVGKANNEQVYLKLLEPVR